MQSKNKRAFAPELVDRFLKNDRFTPAFPPKEIFITIDPNGGGDSDFALVSTYFDRGTMIIAGFESINSKGPDDHNPIIKQHVEYLQSRFPQVCLVFIIENNLGFEAKHIHHFCKNNLKGKICYMAEKDHVGFHTDHKLKCLMYERFNEWLLKDAIRFDEKLFAMNQDKPTEKCMADLTEQLQSYSVITELPKTAFGKIRTTQVFRISLYPTTKIPLTRSVCHRYSGNVSSGTLVSVVQEFVSF